MAFCFQTLGYTSFNYMYGFFGEPFEIGSCYLACALCPRWPDYFLTQSCKCLAELFPFFDNGILYCKAILSTK